MQIGNVASIYYTSNVTAVFSALSSRFQSPFVFTSEWRCNIFTERDDFTFVLFLTIFSILRIK